MTTIKCTAHQRKRHPSVHDTNVNVIIPPLANTVGLLINGKALKWNYIAGLIVHSLGGGARLWRRNVEKS